MKRKILFLVVCIFCLCGCTNNAPKDAVQEYLEKYRNFTSEVEENLQKNISEEDFTEEQQEQYLLIMKRQFVSLEYQIKEEIFNGDRAKVFVDITVFDYHASIRDALEEKSEQDNYIDIQLKKMNEETKRTKYTLEFYTYYENDSWLLEQPDEETLQKIEGITDLKKENVKILK